MKIEPNKVWLHMYHRSSHLGRQLSPENAEKLAQHLLQAAKEAKAKQAEEESNDDIKLQTIWHKFEVIGSDEQGNPIYSFPSEEKDYLVLLFNGYIAITQLEIDDRIDGLNMAHFDGCNEYDIEAWAELPDGCELLKSPQPKAWR